VCAPNCRCTLNPFEKLPARRHRSARTDEDTRLDSDIPALVSASDDSDDESGCSESDPLLPVSPYPDPPPMTAEAMDVEQSGAEVRGPDWIEKWLDDLEHEKSLVEALPFVKGEVSFISKDNGVANDNQVQVAVWCCWQSGQFKRVSCKCDESGAKPTHLEALRALRQKLIDEHGASDHPVHERAKARRAELERDGAAAELTGLDRVRLGMVRLQAVQREAAIAEKQLTQACEAEAAAIRARQEAEAKAKESRAAANQLKPPTISHKRQRTACGSTSTSSASNTTTPSPHLTPDPVSDPEWKQWELDRWRKHETEIQNRRSVPLEPFIGPLPCGVSRGSKPESELRVVADGFSTWAPGIHGTAALPRGDDSRGWRSHWRRGVFGNLLDWASGNRTNIAIMLAESAKHFGVVDEVCLPDLDHRLCMCTCLI
jgi:hypothetical protein